MTMKMTMTMPSKVPELSIIIVTWNASKVIGACLSSIFDNPPLREHEVVIVDNDSTDETLAIVRQADGPVQLVESKQNLGFAGACNAGAHRSTGDYLLFLNSDTIVYPAALEKLSLFLDNHPEAAAAGGKLLDATGRAQVGFNVRAFPTLLSASLELLMLDKLFPKNPVSRRQRMLDFSHETVAEVDQPAGACLAVRRAAFFEAGGFDDGFYPAWFEDVDLCLRLRRRGEKTFFVPEARFLHEGGVSLATLDYAEFLSIWYRNLLRYFGKHHGKSAHLWLRALVLTGMVARVGLSYLIRPRPELSRRAARKAYWTVARNTI